jgi:hypothetical protein
LGAFAVPSIWRQSKLCRWLLTWVGFYVLAYLIVRPSIYSWYALPVFFVESMAAGFSVAALVKMLADRKIEIGSASSAGVFAIGAVFWTSVAHTIGTAPVTRNIYEPLHLWCARHVHPTDKIAASDIGAIGYYSDTYIYDLDGLVWPEVFQYKNGYAAILAKRPKFVFANVTSGYQEMFDANSELGRLYEPVARFAKSGSTDVVPQPDVFTSGWRPDYVMFERRGNPPSANTDTPASTLWIAPVS